MAKPADKAAFKTRMAAWLIEAEELRRGAEDHRDSPEAQRLLPVLKGVERDTRARQLTRAADKV